MLATGRIQPITTYQREHLSIHAEQVLEMLRRGDSAWEDIVPSRVAEVIKSKALFGYQPPIIA